MNSYYVELRYFVPGTERDDRDRHSDAVMEALLVEPNLIDPDVSVAPGARRDPVRGPSRRLGDPGMGRRTSADRQSRPPSRDG
ncbi:MAG: hypothetical protein ACRDRH_15530 [Pseudonocardia sp.]